MWNHQIIFNNLWVGSICAWRPLPHTPLHARVSTVCEGDTEVTGENSGFVLNFQIDLVFAILLSSTGQLPGMLLDLLVPSPPATSSRWSLFWSCFINQCGSTIFPFPEIHCHLLPYHPTCFYSSFTNLLIKTQEKYEKKTYIYIYLEPKTHRKAVLYSPAKLSRALKYVLPRAVKVLLVPVQGGSAVSSTTKPCHFHH